MPPTLSDLEIRSDAGVMTYMTQTAVKGYVQDAVDYCTGYMAGGTGYATSLSLS